MNLEQLIAAYRQRSDDAVDNPYLTSDAEAKTWANEAESQACMRGDLLFDDTSTFTTIAIEANKHSYRLDSRILKIDSAVLDVTGAGRGFDLELTGIDRVQDHYDWRTRTGRPCKAIHLKPNLRLWPTPNAFATGTVQLSVYRLPKNCMIAASSEPEIPREHHDGLVEWMLYRNYSTKDSQQEDPARASNALAVFTARFGELDSADVQRNHRERRRVTTRYGGY